MTYDELKAEAERQGYKLIKKTPYVRLERCPQCGEYPTLWCGQSGLFYGCCQYNSEHRQSERAAKLAWNELVQKEGDPNA